MPSKPTWTTWIQRFSSELFPVEQSPVEGSTSRRVCVKLEKWLILGTGCLIPLQRDGTKPRTEGEVRAAQAQALLPSIARNSPGRPLVAVVAKSNCNYDNNKLGIKVQV